VTVEESSLGAEPALHEASPKEMVVTVPADDEVVDESAEAAPTPVPLSLDDEPINLFSGVSVQSGLSPALYTDESSDNMSSAPVSACSNTRSQGRFFGDELPGTTTRLEDGLLLSPPAEKDKDVPDPGTPTSKGMGSRIASFPRFGIPRAASFHLESEGVNSRVNSRGRGDPVVLDDEDDVHAAFGSSAAIDEVVSLKRAEEKPQINLFGVQPFVSVEQNTEKKTRPNCLAPRPGTAQGLMGNPEQVLLQWRPRSVMDLFAGPLTPKKARPDWNQLNFKPTDTEICAGLFPQLRQRVVANTAMDKMSKRDTSQRRAMLSQHMQWMFASDKYSKDSHILEALKVLETTKDPDEMIPALMGLVHHWDKILHAPRSGTKQPRPPSPSPLRVPAAGGPTSPPVRARPGTAQPSSPNRWPAPRSELKRPGTAQPSRLPVLNNPKPTSPTRRRPGSPSGAAAATTPTGTGPCTSVFYKLIKGQAASILWKIAALPQSQAKDQHVWGVCSATAASAFFKMFFGEQGAADSDKRTAARQDMTRRQPAPVVAAMTMAQWVLQACESLDLFQPGDHRRLSSSARQILKPIGPTISQALANAASVDATDKETSTEEIAAVQSMRLAKAYTALVRLEKLTVRIRDWRACQVLSFCAELIGSKGQLATASAGQATRYAIASVRPKALDQAAFLASKRRGLAL